jgi:hypothetical protein
MTGQGGRQPPYPGGRKIGAPGQADLKNIVNSVPHPSLLFTLMEALFSFSVR